MSKNMELWERLFVTDPQAVKKITGKPYQGNSPKPYFLIQRATEEFGPCGKGWGVEVKSESFFRMTATDVMHSCVVRFWWRDDEGIHEIEQMGQTKACYEKSSGGMMVDEDAGKKSVTDGMVKAMSMLGFAGDIFSGRWDDSSYVQQAEEHYRPKHKPTGEPLVETDRQSLLLDVVSAVKERFEVNDVVGAYGEYIVIEDPEERTFIWQQLDSKIRSAIKKHGESLKEF